MASNKRPLKETNPKAYYRNAYYVSQVSEWLCVATPLLVILGIKWDEYFVANDEKYKLTIGCVLAIVMSFFFAYKKLKIQEKQENKTTMLHYVLWVGVIAAFAFLFKSIIDDLFIIASSEFVGAAGACVIDYTVTQKNLHKFTVYRDASEKLEAEVAARKERRLPTE